METRPPARRRESADWPTAWFADLVTAVDRGDARAALRACRELERLGYEVTLTRPLRRASKVRS